MIIKPGMASDYRQFTNAACGIGLTVRPGRRKNHTS
jgi:hypothetical protein